MKAKWLPISAAVIMALGSASASAVEFHGYMRAGLGANTDGGSQYCYGTGGPNWHTVGRLGDECDTYAELALSQEVYNKADNKFTVNTLVAYGTEEGTADSRGNSWQGVGSKVDPWSGQRMSFREAWVNYQMPSGASLWAGNRYYGRKDIHILDFYYVNNSGYGTGIENVKVGPGNFSAAYVQHKWKMPKNAAGGNLENEQVYSTAHTIDLRYGGLSIAQDQTLEFIALGAAPTYTDSQDKAIDSNTGNAGDYGLDKNGYSFTVEHTLGNLFGGFNKAALQYSTEGYAWAGFLSNHLGDSYNMEKGQKGRKATRLIDWGVVSFGKVDLGYSAIYAQLDKGTANSDDAKWYNVVVRPQYNWTDFTSTVLEAGMYKQDFGSDWGSTGWTDLTKVTIAQQFTAGKGFWARPSLRFFASFYSGDQAIDNNKAMVGAQAEAWW